MASKKEALVSQKKGDSIQIQGRSGVITPLFKLVRRGRRRIG